MTKTMLSLLCGAALFTATGWTQSAKVDKSDQDFLKMAAEADMTTVHLGKMAEDRGATPSVKDFGKTIVQDHTNDYHQVAELAAKTGETIPKDIDTTDNREISHLEKYKTKTFDREFLLHETSKHEQLAKAFKQEAEHGTNPEIKAYANKALPVIEEHLHRAEDLLKTKSAA